MKKTDTFASRITGMGSRMIILQLAILAIVCGAFSSCTLEASHNGNLDGLWHIESIETTTVDTSTGESTTQTNDLSEQYLFWAVQAKMLLLQNKSTGQQYILRFKHENGTLKVYEPYLYDRTNGDKPLEKADEMIPFGITSLETVFTVEHLSSSKMILSVGKTRICFRKL